MYKYLFILFILPRNLEILSIVEKLTSVEISLFVQNLIAGKLFE